MQYVYFYINTIFGLHGLYMVSLFVASWLLSGSWFAGILATFFFIFNKYDFLIVYETLDGHYCTTEGQAPLLVQVNHLKSVLYYQRSITSRWVFSIEWI